MGDGGFVEGAAAAVEEAEGTLASPCALSYTSPSSRPSADYWLPTACRVVGLRCQAVAEGWIGDQNVRSEFHFKRVMIGVSD